MILQENVVATYDFTSKFIAIYEFNKKIQLQLMILQVNLVATYKYKKIQLQLTILVVNLVAIYDFTRKFSCNL